MVKVIILFLNLLGSTFLHAGCQERPASLFNESNAASAVSAGDTLLPGKWVIDSLALPAISIPSFCSQIGEGAVFVFTESDSLKIYPGAAATPCDVYTYKVHDGLIQMHKADMVMLVDYELTQGGLLLRSKTFFRWEEKEVLDSLVYRTLVKNGVTLHLSKAR